MDKLAIIGTGYMARIIAERAKELGVESHCFSVDKHSVAGEVADYFHYINILDVDELVSLCEKIGITGVVATTELTIWPAAYVAEKLGVLGNGEFVSKRITDKSIIREKVKEVRDLYQPKHWVYKGDSTPEIVSYPVVVKPIAAGGKRGVCVVNSKGELLPALMEAMRVSKVEGALIEEFLVGGQEYSVESLSYKGKHYVLQVTQKDSSGPPHCVELGHHQPANLSYDMRIKVEDVIAETLSAAGVSNGPCHTEIKIIENKIYLIEINGRPGGDHIAYPLTELSTGYPYISGIILAALGRLDELKVENLQNNYCGVCFVTSQTSYLKKIFDECESKPWLYKKNKVSDDLMPIIHNDGFNTNYFMYYSQDKKPNILEEEQ